MLAFRRGLILYLDERRLAMPLNRIQNQYRATFYHILTIFNAIGCHILGKTCVYINIEQLTKQ